MTVEALKAEAEDLTISFEYDGVTYVVDKDLDYDTLEALEEGRLAAAVKGLLGPDQHKQFKAKKRKLSHVGELVKAATDAMGTDLGK